MVLTHKRRTRLLSSIPYAYSGFFFITSGILLASSILYIVFLPGTALGQELIQYKNLDFMFNYPAFLSVYESPNGVTLIPASEIGNEYPSFKYNAYAVPYNGPSRNLNELANEIASSIVQTIPNAQFTYVGLNDAGDLAVVRYVYDDSIASTAAATVFNGKLIVFGYDLVMGPNESQYINIGNSIMSSMGPIIPTSNGGGLPATPPNDGEFFPKTEKQLGSFADQNRRIGEMTNQRIEEQNEIDRQERITPGTPEFCLNNQFHAKC